MCVALSAGRPEGLGDVLSAHNMPEVQSVLADIIIADNIPGCNHSDKAGIKAHIVAGYFGKYLTTTHFLESKGKSGACLKFLPFSEKSWTIYFTQGCRAQFGFQVKMLERLCLHHKRNVKIITGDLGDIKRNVRVVAASADDLPDKASHPTRSVFSTFVQSLLAASTKDSVLGLRH